VRGDLPPYESHRGSTSEKLRPNPFSCTASALSITRIQLNVRFGINDALVSFSYNCGSGALAKSTLLKCVNAGDFQGAARQFVMWNKSQGVIVLGLVRRRTAEAALFLTPTSTRCWCRSSVDGKGHRICSEHRRHRQFGNSGAWW
jgi:hypothetical protein